MMEFIPETHVTETLSFLNKSKIPYGLVKVNTKEPLYVTFKIFDERGVLFTDDMEDMTKFYVQVDTVDMKKINVKVARDIKKAMLKAGFNSIYSDQFYNNEAQNYQISYRYSYVFDTDLE